MTPPYKFYIQRFSPNGTPITENAIDVYELWRVVCQDFPYNLYGDLKDYPKRDWKDEHGVSVFIPSDGIKLKDFDIQVKFLVTAEKAGGNVSAEDTLRSNIRGFLNYVYGFTESGNNLTGDGSSLAIYDEYTGFGFGMVTVNKLSNSTIEIKENAAECIGTFSLTFHINDPVSFKRTTQPYLPWRGYNPNNNN